MNKRFFRTLLTGLGAVMAAPLWAAGGPSPHDALAQGKLEADLGQHAKAAEAFRSAAEARGAPAEVRWEALVRLGRTLDQAGDARGSVDAYRAVARDHGDDSNALRFLAEAVAGVVPDEKRWVQIWRDVRLSVDESDPARPQARIDWPGVPPSAGDRTYIGHEVSFDFKDGDLGDIIRLIADVSGFAVVTHPHDVEGTVTLNGRMPWDQVLEHVLASYGFGYRIEGKVIRIGRTEQLEASSRATGDTPAFSGRPIGLEYADEDVSVALAGLAAEAGVTIVVAPEVEGRVTIRLRTVPWDQALDLIARTSRLTWTREGDVIHVRPKSDE